MMGAGIPAPVLFFDASKLFVYNKQKWCIYLLGVSININ